MDFSTTALAVDEMLRRRVDMPANIVHLLAVEAETGEALNVAFRVKRCPGWRELPIEEVAGNGDALVAFKAGLVVD